MSENLKIKKQTTLDGLGLNVCSLAELNKTFFWFSSLIRPHYEDLSSYVMKENQFITLVIKECLVFIIFDYQKTRLCVGPVLIKSAEEAQNILQQKEINTLDDLRYVSLQQLKALGSLLMSYWTDLDVSFQELPLKTIETTLENHVETTMNSSQLMDEEVIRKVNTIMGSGNINDLNEFLEYFNTINLDIIVSKGTLRSTKNKVISVISRYSFIAINEGLDYMNVMKESDEFISRIESYDNVKSCILLLKESTIHFTTLIHEFKNEDYSKYTKYVVKKIKSEYNQNLTLAGLALELNISSSHLSRVLSNETKLSFNDLLNSERIEQAKEFLKYPGNNIAAVAHLCGFTYQNHFTQVFKKHTGITPSEYIKSISPILKQGLST